MIQGQMKVLYLNANSLFNKLTELMVLSAAEDVQIICITETWLCCEILDAEVQIPNFTVFREDRADNSRYGGSAIYVHNSLQAERLDWFLGLESLAVRIKLDVIELDVACIYRSTALVTIKDNSKLMCALENMPINNERELLLVGDVNLPHVNWDEGTVSRPSGSFDKRLLMEAEFLSVFNRKGLHWHVTESSTRVRKVGNSAQTSLLDQVFTYNDGLVRSVGVLAPVGKSDHVTLLVELKVANDPQYSQSEKKSWFKVDEEFVKTHSSDIDWMYSSADLKVEQMWSEMLNKLSLISDKVPSISLKTSKNGEVLQRLPWDCSNLVRKRKCKDAVWKEFDRDPCLANFNVASYEQKVYENAEIKAKMKYEKKITKCFKSNCKPLFNYLKSKSTIRKSVNKLHKIDGSETKSPLETAEVLADFFHSVFQPEPFGPLPKDCYSKRSKVLPESKDGFSLFHLGGC